MYKFTSEGTYNIAGRGTVYTVRSPIEFARDDTVRPFGFVVEIDGSLRAVIGVESYCIPTIRKGMPIGLLVEDAIVLRDRCPVCGHQFVPAQDLNDCPRCDEKAIPRDSLITDWDDYTWVL